MGWVLALCLAPLFIDVLVSEYVVVSLHFFEVRLGIRFVAVRLTGISQGCALSALRDHIPIKRLSLKHICLYHLNKMLSDPLRQSTASALVPCLNNIHTPGNSTSMYVLRNMGVTCIGVSLRYHPFLLCSIGILRIRACGRIHHSACTFH